MRVTKPAKNDLGGSLYPRKAWPEPPDFHRDSDQDPGGTGGDPGQIRRQVPRAVWAVFEEAGELSDRKPSQLFEDFLNDALRAWLEGNKTTRNTPVLLEAVQNIKTKLTSRALESIDLSVLARNNRVRGTGFDGVYHHRDAYVVDVRDPGTGKIRRMPGRYPEPELAAWARYEFYRKHKLPYGKFEEEIARQRNSLMCRELKWPEHIIRANAIWSLAVDGFPPDPAFLRRGEDRWLVHGPPMDADVENHIARIVKFYPDEYPEFVPEESTPTLPPPTKQAALPEAPKPALTLTQVQAEADKARELAITQAREARAKRMAAKYGVNTDTDTDEDQ